MNLEEKTIGELKFLLSCYQIRRMDFTFFKDAIAILNEDALFSNRISTKVDEKTPIMATSTKTLEIKINPLGTKIAIEKSIKKTWDYLDLEREIKNFNLFFLFSVLHEVKHFHQIEIALGRISTKEVIKNAQKVWYEFAIQPMSEQTQKIYDLYNKYHNFLFFEREANITSFKIVSELLNDVSLKEYCEKLLRLHYKLGYINKGPFVKSPVEYTCNLFGRVFDCGTIHNLSFMEKLETGFPLNQEEYQQFVSVFERRFESNEAMLKSLKKIV